MNKLFNDWVSHTYNLDGDLISSKCSFSTSSDDEDCIVVSHFDQNDVLVATEFIRKVKDTNNIVLEKNNAVKKDGEYIRSVNYISANKKLY
jgi:hypothetical protein